MATRKDFMLTMGLDGVASVVTGLRNLIDMAMSVSRKIAEIAGKVADYNDVLTGHSVSVEQARKATAGLVSVMTLHRQAAVMEQRGLRLSATEYQAVASRALAYARATGTDANDAMEQLTNALTRGTSRGLRPFGIELGKTASGAATTRAAVRQLTYEYENQTTGVEDLDESIQQLQNNWERAWLEMGSAAMSGAGVIGEALQGVSSLLNDIGNALEAQRRAIANLNTMTGESARLQLQRQAENAGFVLSGRGMRQRFEESPTWSVGNMLRGASAMYGASVEGMSMDQIRQQRTQLLADINRRMDELTQQSVRAVLGGEEAGGTGNVPATPPPRPPASGGRRLTEGQSALNAVIQSWFAGGTGEVITEASLRVAEEQRIEDAASSVAEFESLADEIITTQIDSHNEQLEEQDRFNELMAEKDREGIDARVQAAQRLQDENIKKINEYAEIANGIMSFVSTAGGGIFETLAITTAENQRILQEAYEDGGRQSTRLYNKLVEAQHKTEKLQKAELAFSGFIMATEALARGILATAEAAFLLSAPVTAAQGVAKAIAAATAFASAASIAAVTGAKIASVRGQKIPRPERSMGGGVGGDQDRSPRIIINNAVVTSRKVNDELRQMERDAWRRSA